MKKIFDKKLLLYCIVGVLNYIICTALMFALYNLGVCNEDVAPLINYGLGSVIWYYSCLKLVFPGMKQTPRLVFLFLFEVFVCYMLTYYVLAPLTVYLIVHSPRLLAWLKNLLKMPARQVEENCRMAIGSLYYAVLNYFGQRYFVFREFKKK